MARPLTAFHGFYGQKALVGRLRRSVRGSLALCRPVPSMVLYGPSGVGKTRLVAALGKEAGTTVRTVFAARALRPASLADHLLDLGPNAFLLLDEAHALAPDAQEMLLLALDGGKVPVFVKGRPDGAHTRPVRPFTLVLATNQPGRLAPALRRRLRPYQFLPYGVRELTRVTELIAQDQGLTVTGQAARRLAEVAHGLPAHVGRRLDELRIRWPEEADFTQAHVERLLKAEGIDRHGLTPGHRAYLRALAETPGQVLSVRQLAARVGTDPTYLLDDLELPLVFAGFVHCPDAGRRRLTPRGAAALFPSDLPAREGVV
jgi:Holliday junction resolvasome RuvABC ATP-dependent DNA helicase subunit